MFLTAMRHFRDELRRRDVTVQPRRNPRPHFRVGAGVRDTATSALLFIASHVLIRPVGAGFKTGHWFLVKLRLAYKKI
jgi:hypothetical protein